MFIIMPYSVDDWKNKELLNNFQSTEIEINSNKKATVLYILCLMHSY